MATQTANPVARAAQESLFQLLTTLRVAYTAVDCTDPAHKELRTAAWAVSGLRAVYPQVFKRTPDGALTFVGDWDAVHAMNESNADLGGLDAALADIARV